MIRFKKFAPLFFILALLCTLALPASTWAQGRMVIKPFVEVGFQSDSNYWLSDTDERDVFTYTFEPGLEFGYTTDKSQILLNYTLSAYWYDDRDTVPAGSLKASDQDYVGHDLQILAQTQVTDRLSLGLNESYLKSRDPASTDQYNNDIDRYKYQMNQIAPQVYYSFGEKFGLRLEYVNKLIDYTEDDQEDYSENRGVFDLAYNLNRLTSIDLEYQVWATDYDEDTSDYTSNQVMLNFNKEFAFFMLTVGAGYHDRSFDDSAIKDIDAFAWKIELSGQNPPKSEITATDPSGRPKSHMMVSLSQNLNDLGTGNNYYTATRFEAEAGHLFLEKLDATISGYFQTSDYEDNPDNRSDDTWFLCGRIDYLINEMFTASLETGYETRDSNVAGYDYDNTYALISFKAAFDLGSR